MIKRLLSFLDASPVNFLAVKNISEELEKNGFHRINPQEPLGKVEAGDKFFVTKNDSSIYAFQIGKKSLADGGFHMICAHCDSPTFRIKPNAEMLCEGGIVKLNTEVYGGPIMSTWFDRPLTLAGRVIVKGENAMNPQTLLLHIQRPLLQISNLAIHFNRQVNDGVKLSKQKDVLPILGIINDELEKGNLLMNVITGELNIQKEDILDFDLYLADATPACTFGVHQEFISSGRLDDLSMCWAGVEAMIAADATSSSDTSAFETTRVLAIFDNEAGTLPDKISESQKNLITNLKIVGKINGTDLKFIREMAGCDVNGKETDGKLSILDLSDAKIVEGGSAYYSDRDDGFIYTSNDKLGDFAFYGCSGLTSLTLPSSVTKIGCYALSSCIGLTSLTLPSSVTEIGEHAFLNCRGLTNFTIPSGVTKIGAGAFFCCYGLISLTIPSSVTAIGSQAFNACSELTSIYAYMEKLPETGSNLFLGCDEKNCTVYVPKGTGDAYFRSAEFGYFYNIVEFDATGIDKVATSANVKEVSRYSANGQRLSAPAKGLNIVKYSDGSVKKVVVQ